jgi:DNA polymerase III gamma/tau subunit
MVTTLISIIVSLTLLIGGAGATVYAAQDSLPNELLYPIKTASEDAQFQWLQTEAQQLQLALEFANRRLEEMARLGQDGQPVPEEIAQRYQSQMMYAFQLAAGMQDEDREQAMAQIRTALQTQEQAMTQLQQNAPEGLEPLMAQVQEMLQAHNRLCDLEEQEPLQFEAQIRQQLKTNQPEDGEEPAGLQFGPGPEAGPQPEDQPGPQPETEPGMGPGPGPEAECPEEGETPVGPGGDQGEDSGAGNPDSGGNGEGGKP